MASTLRVDLSSYWNEFYEWLNMRSIDRLPHSYCSHITQATVCHDDPFTIPDGRTIEKGVATLNALL